MFLATIPPQEVCDSYEKLLDPQGLIRSADLKKRSNERVIGNLKTDSLKSSTLNWYYSKGSGNGRKQIIFLKLVHPMEYSHPFISGVSVTIAHLTFQLGRCGLIPWPRSTQSVCIKARIVR